MPEFGSESKDMLAASKIPDTFDLEMSTLDRVTYDRLMNEIGDLREETVLRAFMEEDMTGEEVGERFGFSADKARQIKAKALQKIKDSPLGKKLILDNFKKTGKY